MIIEIRDNYNNKPLLTDKINYVMPLKGKIYVKGAMPNSFVLNRKPYQHDADFELPIQDYDLVLQVDNLKYIVKILCGEIEQETVIGYLDFYNELKRFYEGYVLKDSNLKVAFNVKNNDALRLCAFNKKFDSLLQSNNRDKILENVKFLPHVFNKPRLHLKQIEEVRPAAIVTRVGSESIRHLASHSEHWKGVKANGLVPERLLARVLEDDYAIYENLAAKTLVDKLYSIEKKENDDLIDYIMNSQLAETYSVGGERQAFFDALNFLLKGFDKKASSTIQHLQEEARFKIREILSCLGKCKSTVLYRNIRHEKEIKGNLKQTNIFMMDNYYKKVYQLWQILGTKEEIIDFSEKKKIHNEFFVYTELIILFALKYMGFMSNDNQVILDEYDKFRNVIFEFKNWRIVLNSDIFIRVEISERTEIKVDFQNIDLPDNEIYSDLKAKKQDKSLIFEEKITPDEQKNLANILSQKMEKGKQQKWKKIFLTTISEKMNKVSTKTERIILKPWKYGIPDDYDAAKETIRHLTSDLPPEYDEYYVLNIMRPNELKKINDEALLRKMVSYSLRNDESEDKTMGIIPISLNDVNSFRRISKIFIKAMILLGKEQKICPQCGSKMIGDLKNGYNCSNKECGLIIKKTQCPNCRKRYWYTEYKFPKTFDFETDSPGMRILLEENDLGFKNITNMNKEKHPICPYCNNNE